MQTVTIVMYHYVRDLPRTAYPRIKGLLTANFEGQLDYIAKYYQVVSLADVRRAAMGEGSLPERPCVLTFDDGLRDHFEVVFPILQRRAFTGAFFAPAKPIETSTVLDVHKIHFLLAAQEDMAKVVRDLRQMLDGYRASFPIPEEAELRTRYSKDIRFDDSEVVWVKSLLQWALPAQVRAEITDELFSRYVTADEAQFARELYATVPELQTMARAGMEIGGHGYNHVWLGKLDAEGQAEEIRRTVSFLQSVNGPDQADWTMSYPFGSYDANTLRLVAERDCGTGVTTKAGLATLYAPLELARLDTNDLPRSAQAAPVDWTLMAERSLA